MNKFGERLKELRKECGLSQDEVAQKLNVSRNSIYNYGVVRTGSPHCSVCGKTSPCRTAFCPNCFAKMDGGIIKPMKRAGDSAKKAAESLGEVINAFENADRCVCCGDIVPEGRQVCPGCETGGNFDG